MTYKRVQVTRLGGPEVLQVVEDRLRPPAAGEVRIRVLAAPVSRPDVTAWRGEALYSGTPLGQKPPFVPGYAVIGDVDAVGDGVRPSLLGERVLVRRFGILEAAEANALLESGQVVGNVVLVAPQSS